MPQHDPSYIVVDFETYYDNEYSLRRMTPVEYIMDPRFEITGCAVAEGDDGPTMWLDTEQLPAYFRSKAHLPFVSHNALFDMCVMAWRVGVRPALMVDTMGMARATVAPFTKGVSLAKVATFFGLGVKTDTILKVAGMGRSAIRESGLWPSYTSYAINDAVLCRDAYKRMRGSFPKNELLVMDMVIRMAACPGFVLDQDELALHAASLAAEKQALLDRVGLPNRDDLMSNEKFASVLSSLGVTPPMKTSRTTGLAIYAFAKSDAEMTALEEHENPDVQALVAARLGHKSTLEETRTTRYQNIANIDWQGAERPLSMPIPLKYSGAHTHRLSGDWSLNAQNLGRSSRLRYALKAPQGYKVVAGDASQIEARINGVVCGQEDLVEAFRQKRDVYSEFASEEIYHRPVNKKDDPSGRFVGKTSILSLGYQSGWLTFRNMIRVQSRTQLNMEMLLSDAEAQGIVSAYRRRYAEITKAWKTLQNYLPDLAHRDSKIEFGPMRLRHQYIESPGGLHLYYHDLKQELIDGQTRWKFTHAGISKDLYGGKTLENMIQHLARLSNMDAAARLRRRWHPNVARFVLQVHDELVYVVRDDAVSAFLPDLNDELSAAPWWAPNAPLAAEVKYGQSYGEAK